MSWAIQLVIALAVFAGGMASGIKYHVGVVAQRDLKAERAAASDRVQQRKFNDQAAGKHAAAVATLSAKLGDARAHIATLSGRPCLDAGTVGVLNAIGDDAGRTPASQPAGASEAVATDRDVSTFIAACRSQHAELASQINQILDIEDQRHPPGQ